LLRYHIFNNYPPMFYLDYVQYKPQYCETVYIIITIIFILYLISMDLIQGNSPRILPKLTFSVLRMLFEGNSHRLGGKNLIVQYLMDMDPLHRDYERYLKRIKWKEVRDVYPRGFADRIASLLEPKSSKLEEALYGIMQMVAREALCSLDEHGGRLKEYDKGTRYYELNRPADVSIVTYADRGRHFATLYFTRGVNFEDLPRRGDLRAEEIERRLVDIINRFERGERIEGVEVQRFDVKLDDRLLQKLDVSAIADKLNGQTEAPLVLFFEFGWLASDDVRCKPYHETTDLGQAVVRLTHWIASIASDSGEGRFFVFRINVYRTHVAEDGLKSSLFIRPIGKAAKAIKEAYAKYGVYLGKSEVVRCRIYDIMRALRETSVEPWRIGRRAGLVRVKDVDTYIAYCAVCKTLILGDGEAYRWGIYISVGDRNLAEKLAEAIGGHSAEDCVEFPKWFIQNALDVMPSAIFDKDRRLYNALANYVEGVGIAIRDNVYLLRRKYRGVFRIYGREAVELAQELKMEPRTERGRHVLELSLEDLKKVEERGVCVEYLDDLEFEEVERLKDARVIARQPSFERPPYAVHSHGSSTNNTATRRGYGFERSL